MVKMTILETSNICLLCFSSADFNLPKVIPACDGYHHDRVWTEWADIRKCSSLT